MVLNSIASIYVPAFNAIIAESLPQERRGAAFGAYRMLTSIPQIFMPVVSGFYLDQMGIAKGVEADMMENFGPVMDMGPGSRMGFLDKKIAQSVMLGLSKDKGMELDMKGRNDLRDWDRIREFAHRVAKSLRE